MKVVLVGTTWPFRGGLASFNERLMEAFAEAGHQIQIETFTTQYPQVLFPGTTQYSQSPSPQLPIKRSLSSINPFSWWRLGHRLNREKPDLIVVKYWHPFMAPCLGSVARLARRNRQTKVICIADNIVPHESGRFDAILTRYFVNSCDGFVTMSEAVLKDLARFDRKKLRAGNPHPMFDRFGAAVSKEEACATLHIDSSKTYVLFFGFIRPYKGLDVLLEAMTDKRLTDIELIVAGEFYTNREPYELWFKQLGGRVHVFDRFIADEEIRYFFSAVDLVVQPYIQATQSGVTQIAYHYEVPMVVSKAGGLPELVPHEQCGLVTDPEPAQVAAAIWRYFDDQLKEPFQAQMRAYKMRFSWERMVQTLTDLWARLRA